MLVMGHLCPTFAFLARLAPTLIIVAIRRAIAIPLSIAPLTSSVVLVISMSPVIMLIVLPFFSFPPIFEVFLFSLPSLLLLAFFLLSVFLLLLSLSLSFSLRTRSSRLTHSSSHLVRLISSSAFLAVSTSFPVLAAPDYDFSFSAGLSVGFAPVILEL